MTGDFAELLRALKERSGRSYGALAGRLHMSTSTLHRYCRGDAVPTDFAPVERFVRLCGATPEERTAVHRAWILADAARGRKGQGAAEAAGPPEAAPVTAEPADGPGAGADPAPADGTAVEPPAAAAPDDRQPPSPGRESDGRKPPRPWHRSVAAVAVAVVVSVLTTLAVTFHAASPEERRRDGARPGTGPTTHMPSAPGRTDGASPHPSAPAGDAGGKSAEDGDARVPSPGNGPENPADLPDTGTKGGGSAGPSRTPSRDGKDMDKDKDKDSAGEADPFTVTARTQAWDSPCHHNFLVDKDASKVPPPPLGQDMPGWAAAEGAVDGDESQIELTVQGRSRSAVVLRALHVRKVGGGRGPLPWKVFSTGGGCGGGIVPASFAVNLDAERPLVRAVPGEREDRPTPAVDFPISVSAVDPRVLRVNARTTGCACSYYLELEWSSGDRHGTTTIGDRGGRPFRTSATEGRRDYLYAGPDRVWVRNEEQPG
ncbi:transcriptional regulator [Streptomyces luteireticuli]